MYPEKETLLMFFSHGELNIRENSIQFVVEISWTIAFDDDKGVNDISRPEFRSEVFHC